jgi:hypothetical protein
MFQKNLLPSSRQQCYLQMWRIREEMFLQTPYGAIGGTSSVPDLNKLLFMVSTENDILLLLAQN